MIRAFLAVSLFLSTSSGGRASPGLIANRLTYLDENEPFYVGRDFPKLTTPQWIGEPGTEAVVILAIDDMREPQKYETFLRPILDRLKQIDGRAPVSIMTCSIDAQSPRLQTWLQEGLSLEVHTLTHPCPLLSRSNFDAAAETYYGCIDLLNRIPGNRPIAFRMPCCDSINSPSPRFYAEIFNNTNAFGQFLTLDSSVMNVTTTNDPALPRQLTVDTNGKEKFRKYLPFPSFATAIEDYPYPYIIGKLCWEFPAMVPSDWESQNLQGSNSPVLLADWKAALDATVLKQGTFTVIFHPYGWSTPEQLVALIDYALNKYGNKVKFLNFREAEQRLNQNLTAGQPLRAINGQDNGIRLVDLNNDGFLDVVIANEQLRKTRVWRPTEKKWIETDFPTPLVTVQNRGTPQDAGVRFGIVGDASRPVVIARNDSQSGAWRFESEKWTANPALLNGLVLDGQPVFTAQSGCDRGARLRDVDGDGVDELIIANESQNAVFAWTSAEQSWRRLPYSFPNGVAIVNAQGQDNGVRFVDLNEDGVDDLVFSNEKSYSVNLMVPTPVLGFQRGWSREIIRGNRGQMPEVPMIVRGGRHRNNGAWFSNGALCVQNEDTAQLPGLILRLPLAELLSGLQPPALSPTQSLAAIQVPADFQIELVASEPMVLDPIYFDWSEDGRLWVVEMRDYPLGIDGRDKPGGAIRVLEDTDGDGRYDKSTVFMEGVNFPTGLMPWRNGILVCAAPDVLYSEDKDRDGKADQIEKLFTGFGEGNQQHRANGFVYGLDNWIYGANGDSGGNIKSLKKGTLADISGRDFRFRPDDGSFETVSGKTQFGRYRDDWGNWFGNENGFWVAHYWLPEHYLRRNPLLAVESTSRQTASYPDASRVYPVGQKQQRLNDIGPADHVTSANSPSPYRDELFGDPFNRAIFISEPAYNLIRCEILRPDGISFNSHKFTPDEPREFLASTDIWFRPTCIRTGPDGALYFADMYRLFIEHPEWIPDDIKKRYDLRVGHDKGRIYRVYPKGKMLRNAPRLDRMSTVELVAAIDHPNGWQRDTAQRLLVTRRDRTAIRPLRKLIASTQNAKARLTALCTLDGLGAVQPEDLVLALNDSSAPVREHAIRISESSLRANSPSSDALTGALLARVNDPEVRVRFQLALSLGEWDSPRAAQALAQLALQNVEQNDVVIAVASSATRRPMELLESLLAAEADLSKLEGLMRNLVRLVIANNNDEAIGSLVAKLFAHKIASSDYAVWRIGVFSQMLQELETSSRSLNDFKDLTNALPPLLASARKIAGDSSLPVEDRSIALRLLGRDPDSLSGDIAFLVSLLSPQVPDSVQKMALSRLGQIHNIAVPGQLVKGLQTYSPSVRSQAVDLLLRREEWVKILLDHLELKEIAPDDLGAGARQRLLLYQAKAVRERARKLLGQSVNTDRQKVIDEYLPLVEKVFGDHTRGAALFAQQCAPCHRLRGQGTGVAPDLATLVDRSTERMLIAILDPSRAVEDRYVNYITQSKSGDEYSGMLISETANTIVLASPTGTRETLSRSDIVSLTSTRKSLMPDGFEQFLKPQDLADVLAYIDASVTPAKSFTGNRPGVVRPDAHGAVRLRASNAEIYGQGIEFESQYKNLGMWNGQNDRAVWTVDVPTGGSYDLWLNWACHDNDAGNRFRFSVGDQIVTGKVPGTGTWDLYKQSKFGHIELPPGKLRAVFQADAKLSGFLIDLLEVRLIRIDADGAPEFEPVGGVVSKP